LPDRRGYAPMPPMDPDHESLRTKDILRLFLWVWPAAGKGWLGIVHGYGEHSGRYDAFARWLSERGWSVAAFHATSRARADGHPVFLLGHALGGLILARHADELEGLAGGIRRLRSSGVRPSFLGSPAEVRRTLKIKV